MTRALWMIRYALDGQDDAAYLDWFHGEHIPEKRARPGYAWAAHYTDGAGRYLALFGANDARTFLDPTPGQWKLRQDELTKRMCAHRRGVSAAILVEVMRAGASGGDAPPPAVRLTGLQPSGQAEEDAAAASLAQERLPALAQSPGCLWAEFMVPVIGSGRYALFEAHHEVPTTSPAEFVGRRIDGGP